MVEKASDSMLLVRFDWSSSTVVRASPDPSPECSSIVTPDFTETDTT